MLFETISECQKRRETHPLVRLTVGIACKVFISSVASDATGEAARFRLLPEAFAGANGKGKSGNSRSQWKVACISGAIVEVSQARVRSDLLLLVPMVRFPCFGWYQGEKWIALDASGPNVPPFQYPVCPPTSSQAPMRSVSQKQ